MHAVIKSVRVSKVLMVKFIVGIVITKYGADILINNEFNSIILALHTNFFELFWSRFPVKSAPFPYNSVHSNAINH